MIKVTNLGLITALIGLLFSIFSCSSGGNKKEAVAPAYKVSKLDTTSTTIYNEFSTTIQSVEVVEIRPKISGYIKSIEAEEGRMVKKNESILKIEDEDYREQLNSAKASVKSAIAKVSNCKLEVQKLTPLVQKGIISPYELESAKSNLEASIAGLEQAKALCKTAQVNLGYTNITSPVDGILGRIFVKQGSLISTNNSEPITTVSGEGDILAYFSLDEKKVLKIREHLNSIEEHIVDNIELILADGSAYKYKGKLSNASGIIDRYTGSIQLKVKFPNPNMEILSGSSGVLRFPQSYNGAILIPQSSTYELQDRIMIYTLSADNRVQSKSIVVEGISGSNYVVSNIAKGETIVIEGVSKLRDGQVISPIK